MINAFSRLSRVVLPYLPERLSVSEEWKIRKTESRQTNRMGSQQIICDPIAFYLVSTGTTGNGIPVEQVAGTVFFSWKQQTYIVCRIVSPLTLTITITISNHDRHETNHQQNVLWGIRTSALIHLVCKALSILVLLI